MAPGQAPVAGVSWGGLADRWEPVAKSPGYVLGLGALGLGMVVMPLLYVALIGGIGYGVWWYFGHVHLNLTHAHGRASLFLLVLYVAPGVAGVALLLLLIKPLVAPKAVRGEPLTLTRFEEPRLFEFVESVCGVIGAPPPKEIAVDCDINASAGFRSGVVSLFRRGDHTLSIGMPLVAAMSRREFAGVLAHEFGHFAQGTGMRFTYVGRSVINWFLRIAFERDAWDEALNRALLGSGSGLLIVLGIVVAVCGLVTRLFLIVIALVGMVLCSFMMRQMEFDADRYETQLVGSSACSAVTGKLVDLTDVFPKAIEQCRGTFRRNKQLPENLPVVVARAERRLTREARDELMRRACARGTGLLDSHPSSRARIAAAEKSALPGLYTDEAAASGLFTDFTGACRKATYGFFKMALGRAMLEATFVPESATGAAAARDDSRRAALARFVGFEVPTWRPLFPKIKSVWVGEDGKGVLARLKHARAELKRTLEAAAPRADEFRTASEELVRMEYARAIVDAGFAVDFRHLGIKRTDRLGLSRGIDLLRDRTAEAAMLMDEAGDAAMDRLSTALYVLGVAGVDGHIAQSAAKRARADALLAAASALREMHPWARSIREGLGKVQALGPSVSNKKDFDKAKAALLRPIADEVRNRLDDARRCGGAVRDPFAAEGSESNLGATLVGASPAWREFEQIFPAAELFVDRWADCYLRTMGELCEISETVERDLARAGGRAKDHA